MTLEAVSVFQEGRIQAFLPSSDGCACKSLFKSKGSTFDFTNPNNLSLEEGQVLKLYLSPQKSILTSFVFFIFPIILLLIIYLTTMKFSEIEWLPSVIALLSLLPSFAISYLYSKFTKSKFQPILLQILNKRAEECASCEDCGNCPSLKRR